MDFGVCVENGVCVRVEWDVGRGLGRGSYPRACVIFRAGVDFLFAGGAMGEYPVSRSVIGGVLKSSD